MPASIEGTMTTAVAKTHRRTLTRLVAGLGIAALGFGSLLGVVMAAATLPAIGPNPLRTCASP